MEFRTVLFKRIGCAEQCIFTQRLADKLHADGQAAERQRLENFRFFGAPHVAIVTTEEPLGTYGAIDCGAYVGLFMLAARACGVASIALAALGTYPAFWREHWGLDPERRVVCGLAFGHEDPEHPANRFRTSRAALADAVRWVD